MNQAQVPTLKELPCYWGGETHSEQPARGRIADCIMWCDHECQGWGGDITKGQWHFGDIRKCRLL